MSEYVVIYERADDGGCGAYLPDLPGVVALGKSRAEVAEGIRRALEAYADDLSRHGNSLPEPLHEVGTIRA